jgi:hypothetical protein
MKAQETFKGFSIAFWRLWGKYRPPVRKENFTQSRKNSKGKKVVSV